jgi:hypothetical protein
MQERASARPGTLQAAGQAILGSSWSLIYSSAQSQAAEAGGTTVNGAKMGVEAPPDLSATLDPKALQRGSSLSETRASLSAARPQSAKPQRAIGRRILGAPSEVGRRTAFDDKALAHIREDLMNSLPRNLTWPGPEQQESSQRGSAAGRRARLHDSPSRNPVAERRFPGAANTRTKEESQVLTRQQSRQSRPRSVSECERAHAECTHVAVTRYPLSVALPTRQRTLCLR